MVLEVVVVEGKGLVEVSSKLGLVSRELERCLSMLEGRSLMRRDNCRLKGDDWGEEGG